jgi:hypothetical protein
MKESNLSGARYGDERDKPSERAGITVALNPQSAENQTRKRRRTHCSFSMFLRNSQYTSFSSRVVIGGYFRNLFRKGEDGKGGNTE